MSWISSILDCTKKLESPREYWRWSALAAISAVVKRNVWLDRGGFTKTYANIFVILEGDSGIKKSLPIDMAQQMVAAVNNTRVIAGRISIQSAITKLGKAYTQENGKMVITACGFLVSKEFETFLIKDDATFGILTDLYDSSNHQKWENSLKHSGDETLKEPYITLLAGSNETNLRKVLPPEAMEGGFMGRLFLIKAKRGDGGKPNILLRKVENPLKIDDLIPYLREISQLEGEFKFEDDSLIDYLETWYENTRKKPSDDKTGFINRLDSHVFKVAMLLSLSKRLNLIITKEDIEEAIDMCELLTSHAIKSSEGTGQGELGRLIKMVLAEMMDAEDYSVTKVRLLRKFYGEFDASVLTKIIDHCLQSKWITENLRANETFYMLTPEIIKALEENKKRLESKK